MTPNRLPGQSMYDYVLRWCHECRTREQLVAGEIEPDMSRFAMLLTPAEYCEFVDDARTLRFHMSLHATPFQPRLFGVAIVTER